MGTLKDNITGQKPAVDEWKCETRRSLKKAYYMAIILFRHKGHPLFGEIRKSALCRQKTGAVLVQYSLKSAMEAPDV